MRKTIINITVVMAIGLTSLTAAPAMARDNQNGQVLGQVLFGALVLGLIAKNVERNRNDNHETTAPVVQTPRHKILPAQCVRRHRTAEGRVRMAALRCLRRNDVRVNRLPDRCFARVETRAGDTRRGFLTRCLKRRGYQFR